MSKWVEIRFSHRETETLPQYDQIFHVGQAFRLDRYAIHFQRNGNMSDSYVKSSSIYESYNRAIHIQACDAITIEDNVIYNIM